MPASKSFLVVPNDSALLPPVIAGATSVAIYVGIGGVIKVLNASDNVELLTVPSGAMIDILVKKVFATGTTGSQMLGIYKT